MITEIKSITQLQKAIANREKQNHTDNHRCWN